MHPACSAYAGVRMRARFLWMFVSDPCRERKRKAYRQRPRPQPSLYSMTKTSRLVARWAAPICCLQSRRLDKSCMHRLKTFRFRRETNHGNPPVNILPPHVSNAVTFTSISVSHTSIFTSPPLPPARPHTFTALPQILVSKFPAGPDIFVKTILFVLVAARLGRI